MVTSEIDIARETDGGPGPLVEAPLLSLVMSMTGPTPAYDHLSGGGVVTLRSR